MLSGSTAFSADLDAYWPLDNSTDDVSGNNHNLQNGTVTFSTVSKVGTHSASFNGTSDFLQYSDSTFLNQAISYLSYSFWIKPSTLTGLQTLLDEGGATNGIAIRLNDNILECAVRENNVQMNTSTFTFSNDGTWHHVALTYNNGDVIMYLDGIATTTLNTGFSQLAAHPSAHAFGKKNSDDAFGSGSNVDYYQGLMDEVTHYTSVLTQTEVNDLYNLLDTDGDGILDYVDIDDDNDGILDSIEQGTLSGYDAYWTLDGETNDTSGNNYNLISGSVTYSSVSVKGSNSASFDGTSNFLQYNDGVFLNKAITNFSHSFWIKPNSLIGIQTLLDEGGGTNGIAIRLNDNILENAVREGGAGSQVNTSSFTFPNDGAWHHIAITYSNGDVIMYLDGAPSSTLITGFSQLAAHSSPHAYGRSSGDSFGQGTGNYYGGLMDEILHYPSVLSQVEIKYLYLSGNNIYNSYDRDVDGILNKLDLDSDNDGIPDNVEAQETATYSAPSGIVTAEGLWDNYGAGLIPIDKDGDGLYDYIDSDSDGDLVTDCKESYELNVSKICPVDNVSVGNTVGINGLVEWAEFNDDYTEPNGIISDPLDLEDEISGDDERAYREAACGAGKMNLTAYQWKTISFSCDTGTNGIEVLLGASLGTYGDEANWVMYAQRNNYTGDRNTDMRLMNVSDTVVPGRGYWIIADATVTAKITRPLSGIGQTVTVPASGFTGVPTTGQAFDEVFAYNLPDSLSTDFRKVLIGNPFFKTFNLSDVYYQYDTNNYVSTATLTAGSSSMEPIVYVKDSNDTTTGNYVAIDPGGTPGFGDRVPVMQGYWIKLNPFNPASNKITFPYER